MPTADFKSGEPAMHGYQAHRERQQRRILDAAETLFDQRGIDRVSMAEITVASGIRASTLYQYFSNKDDVVWALVSDHFQATAEQLLPRIASGADGLAKVTALLEFMAEELENKGAKVRLMAQFDALYARDWPVERLLTLEAQIHLHGFGFFREVIREGIADGSLRSDLNPDLTLQSVMNTAVGAQRRLASLGNKVEVEYGQPIGALFRETIRLLVFGLRADNTPAGSKATRRAKPAKRPIRKRPS